MRSAVLLVLLAGLAGCAGLAGQSGEAPGLADVRAKIALGRCDEGLVAGLNRYHAPELEQEAAYICLQQGEIEAVETLLSNYDTKQRNTAHADYSVYLLALAQQLRFEMTDDDLARIREGRVAHQRYADFARSYPESAYRSEVGPRLNTLFEEMARAEHRLALTAAEAGNMQRAQARMSYITRYYPHSSAAREANDWLEKNAVTDEQDNTAPGNAWESAN